jgi:hypothetical protein
MTAPEGQDHTARGVSGVQAHAGVAVPTAGEQVEAWVAALPTLTSKANASERKVGQNEQL